MKIRSNQMQRIYQVIAVVFFLALFVLSILISSKPFIFVPIAISLSYITIKKAIDNPRVVFFDLTLISDNYALRQLSSEDFVYTVAQIYSNHGYSVQLNINRRYQIIAIKGGRKRVIRCMTYANPTTDGDIREMADIKAREKANSATLASSGEFTELVRNLSKKSGVGLLDGNALFAQIRRR